MTSPDISRGRETAQRFYTDHRDRNVLDRFFQMRDDPRINARK